MPGVIKNVNPRNRQPIKDSTHELHSQETPSGGTGNDDIYNEQQQKSNDIFYSGKKDDLETHKKETSIETTIVGGVTAGLLLRLILWLI